MKEINKITLESKPLNITFKRVFIGVNNLQNYEIYDNTLWWIPSQRLTYTIAYYANANKSFTTTNLRAIRGVRPYLFFGCDDINIGDEFILDKWLFKVVSDNVAICETVVAFCPYAERNSDCKKFADSIPGKTLQKWYQSTKDKPCFKAHRTGSTSIVENSVQIPTKTFAQTFHSAFINMGVSYWLRDRRDEFSAYCVNSRGDLCARDLNEFLNVLPIVEIQNSNHNYKEFDIFELSGRLLYLLNADTGLCLCVNSIGMTPYSTGVMPIEDTEKENEFFKDSELYKVFQDWINL